MSIGSGPSEKEIGFQMPRHPAEPEDHGDGNWLVSYADMMTLLVGFFIILLSFSTIDHGKFEEVRRAATKQFGGSYQVPYGDIADRIRSTLEKLGLGDQFVVKQTDLGVDISFMGTVFFDTGSADIKPEGTALLDRLIPVIWEESRDFDLVIEGHTDDVAIGPSASIKTNWELSSLRACRVLQVFNDRGFTKNRLTAVGYGDAKPVVPNRDGAGNPIPANRSQNRRVVIKLLKRPAPSVGVEEYSQS